MPDIKDLESDVVSVSVDLANVGFLSYNNKDKMLMIEDLSGPSVEAGCYRIVITLNDGRNSVFETVILEIRDPEESAVQEEQIEDTSTTSDNEPSPANEDEVVEEDLEQSIFDWR